ncbi:uncharacterized protein [Aegilops tauschii subsp. strangulata]|uniref:uncharacterized protein n=1 Tax=Aegilops tauschii subsp. strangulata TaxID=200361 RepID=UPI003CC84E49
MLSQLLPPRATGGAEDGIRREPAWDGQISVDSGRPCALLAPSSPTARRLRPPLLCHRVRGLILAQAGPRRSALARVNPSLHLAVPDLPRTARAGSARPHSAFACAAPSAPKPVRAALPSRARTRRTPAPPAPAACRLRAHRLLPLWPAATMVSQDGLEPPNSCFLSIFLEMDNFKKASTICPESDMEALNNFTGSTPEQLSGKLNRLKQRFDQESRSNNNLSRHVESIDDLRALHDKMEQKIFSKQQLFNEHLRKKGIRGLTYIDYQSKVLSIELTMPQDASHDTVRHTRGLSGGERSFSTLCFALALHGMTEAPFRAMDEFDVFMDAVSRKISLDTLVDFAVAQGSQWIFITPHDISMVKPRDRKWKIACLSLCSVVYISP